MRRATGADHMWVSFRRFPIPRITDVVGGETLAWGPTSHTESTSGSQGDDRRFLGEYRGPPAAIVRDNTPAV